MSCFGPRARRVMDKLLIFPGFWSPPGVLAKSNDVATARLSRSIRATGPPRFVAPAATVGFRVPRRLGGFLEAGQPALWK